MSRSKPNRAENPAVRFFEWKAQKGVLQYYDKANKENVEVLCKVTIEGKTGVEMEALTGANIACLTIYDMCKSISQEMVIKEVKLLEKTGGKSDIKN